MIPRGVWSAPANLLIAGEYAVTRDDGRGVAVAISPRGTARLFESTDPDASGIGVVSRMGSRDGTVWPGGSPSLVDYVVETVLSEEPDLHGAPSLHEAPSLHGAPSLHEAPFSPRRKARWSIEIDTTQFFDPVTGTKGGLGSSAVATLLLVAALRRISGTPGHDTTDETTVRLAVKAHRAANRGRGSGYDILTSAEGGTTLFVGGDQPRHEKLSLLQGRIDERIELYTWRRGTPVSSSAAVSRFDRYAPKGSDIEKEIVRRNNELITGITAARTWNSLFRAVQASARFGTELGVEIGVSGELPFVSCHSDDGWIAKASGAGNERAVIFARNDRRRPLPVGTVPVTIERTGLLWEGNGQTDGDGADRDGGNREATG